MYKTFRVKNFRCFKNLQINDLGRVNLIAGKNNTGKTALLEAMYLHTRPRDPKILSHVQYARDLTEPDGDLTSYWAHHFCDLDTSVDIEIEGKNDDFSHKLTIFEARQTSSYQHFFRMYVKYHMDFGASQQDAIRMVKELDAAVVMQYSPADGSERFSQCYADGTIVDDKEMEIESLFIPAQGRPQTEFAMNNFGRVVREGQLAKLVSTLKSLEPRLSDLRSIPSNGEQMIWGEYESRWLPIKLMGEGVNRACHFVVSLMSGQDGYLFIDEIENGIHFSAQKEIWKAVGAAANESGVQVFATTHSLEMIRAAYEAFSEDGKLAEFRYHRLYRSLKSGDIKATTYNELDMEAVADFDFDHEVR